MSEHHNVDEVTESESLGYVNCSDDSDVSKDESDSAEEIWDLECDTESEFAMKHEDNLTTMIVFGISIFLAKFQLLFHLSERAMVALLQFLRHIMAYLFSITNNALFKNLLQKFPNTMWRVKRIVQSSNSNLMEYVVCPKCDAQWKKGIHALYLYSIS